MIQRGGVEGLAPLDDESRGKPQAEPVFPRILDGLDADRGLRRKEIGAEQREFLLLVQRFLLWVAVAVAQGAVDHQRQALERKLMAVDIGLVEARFEADAGVARGRIMDRSPLPSSSPASRMSGGRIGRPPTASPKALQASRRRLCSRAAMASLRPLRRSHDRPCDAEKRGRHLDSGAREIGMNFDECARAPPYMEAQSVSTFSAQS